MERIAVIGTGYVGLVAGAVFAANGHKVICADVDKEKIARLQKSEIPIYEPGLDAIVRRANENGTLSFTHDVPAAIRASAISLIAVGTPSKEDGSFDGVYLRSALQAIAQHATGQHLVVIKSTITPDLYDEAIKIIGTKADLAVNPEFMAEGTAVQDFSKPNRVIIGTDSARARTVLTHLYRDFLKSDPQNLLVMRPHSAIVAKLASNAALAMKVTFINEIARFCDATHADVEEVRVGMSHDPRIGKHFLYAGPGYGGSCFPKDVQALTAVSKKLGLALPLIGTVEPANERHKRYLVEVLRHELGALAGKTIAVWGIAFKAGTDDIRDAAAITIMRELLQAGAHVRAHDPKAMEHARRALPDVHYGTKEDAVRGADALLVLTEWPEYKNPDPAILPKIVVDGRNILDKESLPGITYRGVGRR